MFNKLLLGSFLLTTSVYCSNQASSSNLSLRASGGYNSDDAPLKFEDDGYTNSAKLRHLLGYKEGFDQLKKFCEQEERDGRKVDFVNILRDVSIEVVREMESGLHEIIFPISRVPSQELEKMAFVFSRLSDCDLQKISNYGRFGIFVMNLVTNVSKNYNSSSDLVGKVVCEIKRLISLSDNSILEFYSSTNDSIYNLSEVEILRGLAHFARLGLANNDVNINDLIKAIILKYSNEAPLLKSVCPEISGLLEEHFFGNSVLNYELYRSIVNNDLIAVKEAIEAGAKPKCMIPLTSTNSDISALQVAVLSRCATDVEQQFNNYRNPEFISLDIVSELLKEADAKVLTDFENSDLNFDYNPRGLKISGELPLIRILFNSRVISKPMCKVSIGDYKELAQLLSMFLNRYVELGLKPKFTDQAIIQLREYYHYSLVKDIVVSYRGKDMTVDQMIKEALS